jgi:hypothetical protein
MPKEEKQPKKDIIVVDEIVEPATEPVQETETKSETEILTKETVQETEKLVKEPVSTINLNKDKFIVNLTQKSVTFSDGSTEVIESRVQHKYYLQKRLAQ